MLPAVFTIKFLAKTPRALFPPVHDGDHTTNVVGVISQGPSSQSGNSVDSLGPSPRASGSLTYHPASLSWMLPTIFTIKLPAKMPWALFPLVHGGGHTTNAVSVISQDYKPSDVQQWCSQAPSGKSCTNLTKY